MGSVMHFPFSEAPLRSDTMRLRQGEDVSSAAERSSHPVLAQSFRSQMPEHRLTCEARPERTGRPHVPTGCPHVMLSESVQDSVHPYPVYATLLSF